MSDGTPIPNPMVDLSRLQEEFGRRAMVRLARTISTAPPDRTVGQPFRETKRILDYVKAVGVPNLKELRP